MSHSDTLEQLHRQLRNAKQRARYWSGNPSGRGFGFSPITTATADADADADAAYEMAMDDCAALADEIERITGKRPRTPDPKQDFNDEFSKSVLPMLAARPRG
ncbi:MAG: hypothetical protein CMK74_03815 [Pseudomonadales bacterium]|nr:hypothetical protein [Pseudomonadales bacterium]|tara:strand:- start:71 stop:379 length:309 start_codon:yes stop_codon:yes gene_type:complete